YAVLLAAGLKGIEEGYDLPEEAVDDIPTLTRMERKAMGFAPLPESLEHALRNMEESELVAETLGEQAFQFFLRNKREDWQRYRAQVTPWEFEATLDLL